MLLLSTDKRSDICRFRGMNSLNVIILGLKSAITFEKSITFVVYMSREH